jgi:hypothetical protein
LADIRDMRDPLDPNLMSPVERIREVGELLALGILRLRAKEEETGRRRDLSLDFPATRSVHGRKRSRREPAWKTAC